VLVEKEKKKINALFGFRKTGCYIPQSCGLMFVHKELLAGMYLKGACKKLNIEIFT
jgi:hypothetical protein